MNLIIWTLLYSGLAIVMLKIAKLTLHEEIYISAKEFVWVVITFGVFGLVLGYFSNFSIVLSMIFAWLLVIGYIDLKIHSIYHWTLIIACILHLGGNLLYQNQIVNGLLGGLIGLIIYGVIYGGAYLYYKREAFGFGDVLLMGSLGLFFGLQKTVMIAMLSFYIALIGIVIIALVGKKMKRSIEIAFAPYMILSAMAVALFEHQIIELYRSIFMI